MKLKLFCFLFLFIGSLFPNTSRYLLVVDGACFDENSINGYEFIDIVNKIFRSENVEVTYDALQWLDKNKSFALLSKNGCFVVKDIRWEQIKKALKNEGFTWEESSLKLPYHESSMIFKIDLSISDTIISTIPVGFRGEIECALTQF